MEFCSEKLVMGSLVPVDEWAPLRALRQGLPVHPTLLVQENAPYEARGGGYWMDCIEDAIERALESQHRRMSRQMADEGSVVEEAADFDPSRHDGVVKDQLAYYVPYPTDRDPSSALHWGIHFRANKMLDDFRRFHSRLSALIPIETSWGVYVQTVFWHELAHHVVQDAWLVQGSCKSPPPSASYASYSLMPKSDEEGFCEYMAFSAVEQGFSVPRLALCDAQRDRWATRTSIPLIPRCSAPQPGVLREYVLCALYWHWGRDHDPDYRPRVTPRASEAVGPIWRPFWEAHRRGVPVISAGWGCDLIWDRVFVTDK